MKNFLDWTDEDMKRFSEYMAEEQMKEFLGKNEDEKDFQNFNAEFAEKEEYGEELF